MKSLGFTRQLRLTRPAEFKVMFDAAQRLGNRQLNILCRANGLDYARLGLIVARKHLRHANQRNRLKRQIRESFRLHQHALQGRDIVVLLRADVSKSSNAVLREQLTRGWEQVKEQCAPSS